MSRLGKTSALLALGALGVYRLVRHSHFTGGGMRVGMRGLTLWSFLMASCHGAGLMVTPVFVGMSMAGDAAHLHHAPAAATSHAGAALVATGVHAVSYLAATALVALLVFDRLGVGILRRAWINLDVIWAAALIATGAVTLLL